MISRRVFRTAALAVAVLTAGGAFAQSGSGTIAGLVVDSSGGAIPGAQVGVDHEDTGVTSDRDILVGKVDHKLVGKVDHKPGMNDLLTVRYYLNNSGTDVTGSYGNPVADPLSDASDVRVSRWFNTAAFVNPAAFTFGNSPRSVLRGPGFATTDLTLEKTIPLGDRAIRPARRSVQPVQPHEFQRPGLHAGRRRLRRAFERPCGASHAGGRQATVLEVATRLVGVRPRIILGAEPDGI
jgi:hypothetical protein